MASEDSSTSSGVKRKLSSDEIELPPNKRPKLNPLQILAIKSDDGSDESFSPLLEAQQQPTTSNTTTDVETIDNIDDLQPLDSKSENSEIVNDFPFEPVRKWDFQLDDFQRKGIIHLENKDNILVTAHTSAGKTVLAEYAIAKAMKANSRVIYTSPIKALSNQKYREFSEKFGGDVGLITGDVSKNPSAGCLVMTTEILRNMLYQGKDTMREVSYVIFDEVHYMCDAQRGVVWEESIILLDSRVTLVFLSATISNADDFADWVTTLKSKKCHVISTFERPIPLEHYLFPAGADGLFMIHDGHSFNEANFDKAMVSHQSQTADQSRRIAMRTKKKLTDMHRLLSLLHTVDWLPVIIFAFSRREVEGRALALQNINLSTPEESTAIEEVFNNAIESLTEEDKNLPAIQCMLPMLKRGLGVHHSGILPILKEITEILFQEGLIKVLFATETFAMGINMPAKCVVFQSLEKYDGVSMRFLKPGEYIQMSGRAGRRGIDKHGFVILMANPALTKETCQELMCEKPDPLKSSFRLTYNMVLNVNRVSDLQITCNKVIEKSFYRFLVTQRYPFVQKQITLLSEDVANIEKRDDFKMMDEYFGLYRLREEIQDKICSLLQEQPGCLNRFLQAGRLVYIQTPCKKQSRKHGNDDSHLPDNENELLGARDVTDWGWGIVMSFCKRYTPDQFFVDVLIPISTEYDAGPNNTKFPQPISDYKVDLSMPLPAMDLLGKRPKYGIDIVRFMSNCVRKVSTIRLSRIPNFVRPIEYVAIYGDITKAINHRFRKEIPTLDPFTDMQLDTSKDESTKQWMERLQTITTRMAESDFSKKSSASKHSTEYNNTMRKLHDQYTIAKRKLTIYQNKEKQFEVGQFREELKNKLRLLRRLGYVDENQILSQKGIVACNIETADELLVTELMFDGVFMELEAIEIAALLGAIMDVRTDSKKDANEVPKMPGKLNTYFSKMRLKMTELIKVKKECGIEGDEVDEDAIMSSFQAHLIPVAYSWLSGASFTEVCKMSITFEGSLIRALRSLDDLLRQLLDAVKAIGNDELQKKFEKARKMMKHGIVFAASLYVDEVDNDGAENDDDDDGDDDNQLKTNVDNDGDKADDNKLKTAVDQKATAEENNTTSKAADSDSDSDNSDAEKEINALTF